MVENNLEIEPVNQGRKLLLNYQAILLSGAIFSLLYAFILSPGQLKRIQFKEIYKIRSITQDFSLNNISNLIYTSNTKEPRFETQFSNEKICLEEPLNYITTNQNQESQKTEIYSIQPFSQYSKASNKLNLQKTIHNQTDFTKFFNIYAFLNKSSNLINNDLPIIICPIKHDKYILSGQNVFALKNSIEISLRYFKNTIYNILNFSLQLLKNIFNKKFSVSNIFIKTKVSYFPQLQTLILSSSEKECLLTFEQQNFTIQINQNLLLNPNCDLTKKDLFQKYLYIINIENGAPFLFSNIIPSSSENTQISLPKLKNMTQFSLIDAASNGILFNLLSQIENQCSLLLSSRSQNFQKKFSNITDLQLHLLTHNFNDPSISLLFLLNKLNIQFNITKLASPCSSLNLIIQYILHIYGGMVFYVLILIGWCHSFFSLHPLTLIHLPRLYVYTLICVYRLIILYWGGSYFSKLFDQYFDFSDHIVLSLMCLLIFSIELCASKISQPSNSIVAYFIHIYYYLLIFLVYYSIFITSMFFHTKLEILSGLIVALGLFGFFWFLTEKLKSPSLSRIGILRSW